MEDSSVREITGIPHVGREIYCLPFLVDKLLSLKDWYEFCGEEERAVSEASN